ncbi:hypothetical protein SERLADRAFT_375296 [Serpula lacrymans var. lacrymans S7.9]|uniref:Uncharacterized protein n=1 Tax=Serpula lacrymans var. lacrymans (strain S7.9) TaxID=578457 RepID=F8ND61_SERL9|nr:uncharacterized protein SERLADRAFT_375296 [Serpula lacrymans var. lacrymans S7.9]EGO30145.1 hypothetical protein SERLADRAFT_375296 [Serpula lacrymans var. lacrymans S7.9]
MPRPISFKSTHPEQYSEGEEQYTHGQGDYCPHRRERKESEDVERARWSGSGYPKHEPYKFNSEKEREGEYR